MTELSDILELQLSLTKLAFDPAEADLKTLLPNLHHSDRSIRLLTIRVLEELGDEEAIPGLLAATADEDDSVAQEASAALREFRSAGSFSSIAAGTTSGDARVRYSAAIALRDNFSGPGYEFLLPLLADDDAAVRREAAIGIAHSPNANGNDLLPLLRDSDASVRRAALAGIAARKADPNGHSLKTLLADPDWRGRAEAAAALASSASRKDVQESLLQSLRDDHWQVVKAGIASLGGASPCVVQKLLPFLTHSESDIRIATAATLGRLGNPAAIEALRGVANDPDAGVRKASAGALEQISAYVGWA